MHFNPKFKHVELHSHLDGSFNPETLFKIAQKNSIQIPYKDAEELKKFLIIEERTDLRTFLKKFETAIPIVAGNKEALAEICDEYIINCAKSKICYIETRFAPELLTGTGCDVDCVVVTILDTLERSGKKHGVVAKALLSAMRHMDQSKPTVLDLARKYRSHGVVGIDVAGDEMHSVENKGTREDIVAMFKEAKKEGIHRTAHAGENGPWNMVEEAVNKMHAERIGHGYRVLDDENTYQKYKNDIHFELCPSSSLLTGSVSKKLEEHPIHRFAKDQVNYSISCDDMMITGRDLAAEYEFCRDKFNMSLQEFDRCNLNAAKSSFLDEDDKEVLLKHLKH